VKRKKIKNKLQKKEDKNKKNDINKLSIERFQV
jgi:hypothetical protein